MQKYKQYYLPYEGGRFYFCYEDATNSFLSSWVHANFRNKKYSNLKIFNTIYK